MTFFENIFTLPIPPIGYRLFVYCRSAIPTFGVHPSGCPARLSSAIALSAIFYVLFAIANPSPPFGYLLFSICYSRARRPIRRLRPMRPIIPIQFS